MTWGIFVTFIAGLVLAYAGWRIRTAHLTEPPLAAARRCRRRRRRGGRGAAEPREPRTRVAERPKVDGGEQLSFDE